MACQIGFQSLGSHAVPAIRELITEGAVGRVTGIGGAGAWVRDEAYFRRASWAGRRRLDGADVVDGALTNPLAHAVATALALAGSTRAEDVAGIETELLRANDIESDDTSCVRVTTVRGGPVTVAATLCAEHDGEPYIVVHGTSGRITFWYKQDRVLLQRAGHGPEELRFGRTDLLENLLAHLHDGTGLLVTPTTPAPSCGSSRPSVPPPTRLRCPTTPGAASPARTAGWCPASTPWSRPPRTACPSTPSWAPPGPGPPTTIRRKR